MTQSKRHFLLFVTLSFLLGAQVIVSHHDAQHFDPIHTEACVTQLVSKHSKAIVNSTETFISQVVIEIFDLAFTRSADTKKPKTTTLTRGPPSL